MNHVKNSRLALGAFGGTCCLVVLLALFPSHFPGGPILVQKLQGKATTSDRLAQYGAAAESRWHFFFVRAGVVYPPQKLAIVGLKQEKQLEIYAASGSAPLRFIRSLPILAASGKIGPKLHEGDLQVPEGIYHIESLNPNSAFHLALRVSYPSAQDHAQAALDGRRELGGDIMIHGSNASIGCLAMGDVGAEDLFVLAAQTGIENIEVLLCPLDFRAGDVAPDPKRPAWVEARYVRLRGQLKKLAR